jgi:hypothetical protein
MPRKPGALTLVPIVVRVLTLCPLRLHAPPHKLQRNATDLAL